VNSLVVGVIAGAFGVGYFIYGKKQQKFAPMLAGVLLCIYPYATENLLWLVVIGLALLAFPFLVDF
jgi:branched-subunit amino acid transport protein